MERPREKAGAAAGKSADGLGDSVSTVCCSEFRGSQWGRD